MTGRYFLMLTNGHSGAYEGKLNKLFLDEVIDKHPILSEHSIWPYELWIGEDSNRRNYEAEDILEWFGYETEEKAHVFGNALITRMGRTSLSTSDIEYFKFILEWCGHLGDDNDRRESHSIASPSFSSL